jgi:hypothetical protein
MELSKDGVYVVGVLEKIEPVVYGERYKDEAKRGQAIPGFFRAILRTNGRAIRVAEFNEVDRETGEVTEAYQRMMDPGLIGHRLALRSSVRGRGGREGGNAAYSGYVNFGVLEVVDLGEPVEADDRNEYGALR